MSTAPTSVTNMTVLRHSRRGSSLHSAVRGALSTCAGAGTPGGHPVRACTTVPGAISAGVLCWGFYSGFVLDRFGVLTLAHGCGQALTLIVLAAMTASVITAALRLVHAIAADLQATLDRGAARTREP